MEQNYKSIIRDLVISGNSTFEGLKISEKKEVLSSFIRSLSNVEKWELIADADKDDTIPDLFAEVLDGDSTASYFIHSLFNNAVIFCEERLEDVFEEELFYKRILMSEDSTCNLSFLKIRNKAFEGISNG